MNIQIIDKVGLIEKQSLYLCISLLENRKPKEGCFDYGLETHFDSVDFVDLKLTYPIQVYQSGKRKTDKSPIKIIIEKHHRIL